MSLDPYNFQARTILDLQTFFQSIVNHLDAQNYDNSTNWEPNITNLTGTHVVTSFYQRFGQMFNFTILVDGNSITSSSVIDNLPITALNYGIVNIFNQTDNVLIGNSYINKGTKNCYLPDWSLTAKKIIVQGNFQISGI